MFLACGIRGIQAPVTCVYCHASASIKVTGCHPGPPACDMGKCRASGRRLLFWSARSKTRPRELNRRVPSGESSPIIVKNTQGSPLTGQDEFRVTIPVEITPHGATNQT